MTRSSDGTDVKAEKSKVLEWVKLPTRSTVHIQPSLLGANEFPDSAGPYDCGSGVGEAGAGAEVEAGLDAPQLPKAD